MPLVEVLLGLISIMVTLVLAILGAMYRELITNVKPQLQKLAGTTYGVDDAEVDDGLVGEVHELNSRLENESGIREQEHKQVKRRLDTLSTRLEAVIAALRGSDDVDISVNTGNNHQDD